LTNYSYVVTYDPDSTAVDITDFVQQLKFKESGTGEIRSATLTLNCDKGAFITNTNSGATPIIDEFDVIQFAVTDEDSVTFTVNYEADNLKPVDTVQRGTVQDFELLGPEQHLIRFTISIQSKRRDQADSAFVKSNEIIDLYNLQKGSLQPSIIDHDDDTANILPKTTANHYPFSVKPWKAYDALEYIHDRIGSSVAAGGGGDFWEFGFNRDPLDETQIKFYSDISGIIDSGVTIDQSVNVNPGEEEGGIQSTVATVHATWGADGQGTYPPQVGQFRDALTAWAAMPDYLSGESYKEDSIIRRRNTGPDSQGDELHYKANKDTSSTPPTTEVSNTDWDTYNFVDFLTNEISISGQYSPWTNAIANEWKSSGANPGGSQNDDPPLTTSLYVWDMNQVIYDDTFFRIDVDARATSPAGVDNNYKYGGTGFYRGFRVLVDGTGTGDFTGFDNNIVEYDDDNDEWRLFRSTSNDEYVAVDAEAKVYKKSGGTWSDDSNNSEANDCYHAVLNISNVAGHIDKNNGAGGTFGDFSAVQYEFRWERADALSPTARKYYRAGATINLRAPFPHNSFNGNTLGSLFGSDSTVREPVTFDTNNMDYASNSKRSFNHIRADEYGPFEAIRFMTDFEWRFQTDGSGGLITKGNIPCKCFMYDIHGNVVTADFTISHNHNWEEITIPFTAFTNYRARIPLSLESTGANIFIQELEILQRFDYTSIRKIGFQWMAPFDDKGRYSLLVSSFGELFPSIIDLITDSFASGYNIKWKIDAFHFVKPLLSVSPPVTTGRAMFTEFDEEPLIYSRYQNDQANLAKLEQLQFRHRTYEIVTEGRFDINLFETFRLTNSDIINDSDGAANTIALVAKEIEYTITKPDSAGIGGFLRKIIGVKRIE